MSDLVPVTIEPVESYHLAARNPQQMAAAQANLASWFQHKTTLCETEVAELTAAVAEAKVNKWKSSTLQTQLARAKQRSMFYNKCLLASQQGFTLIPNIPVDIFAVRVIREVPKAEYSVCESSSHWTRPTVPDVKPALVEAGVGKYVSPQQIVSTNHQQFKNDKGTEMHRREIFVEDFDAVEFPVIAAMPMVMQATQEAMMLKIFDQFGVSPQNTRKGDPLIIGHIRETNRSWSPKHISFLIAWHVDLRTL